MKKIRKEINTIIEEMQLSKAEYSIERFEVSKEELTIEGSGCKTSDIVTTYAYPAPIMIAGTGKTSVLDIKFHS